MKKFYFVLILLFSLISSYAQTSGIFESYVLVDTGSGNIWYDIHSPTDLANDDITRDNFDGFNFGTIGTQNGTLTLNGGINNTFDCFPDQVVSGYLNYRIYPSSLPSGTYTGIDLSTNINNFGSACFGADTNQSWSTSNNNSNLLSGLSTGNYTIEVYSLADFNYDDGLGNTGSGIHYVNNNSNNFTAFFTADNPPTAICQDVTLTLDASGNATLTTADVDNGSTDDFDGATLIYSFDVSDQTAFTCADIATPVTVTLTVEDSQGQTDFCTATVTVEDNVNPMAVCQDITVQLDAAGNASITTTDIDNGSSDACGIASLSLDTTSFTCANVGANTVTLTVTDNNGNTSSCTATVTVEDNVNPMAVCQDITVQLDAAGNASITTTDIDNGSSDACGIASLSLDTTSFTCANVGANTVTLTVTDNNGNTSSCTATVTVEDNVNPMAVCQDITVQLDAAGNASITTTDIDNGSSDACGIASLSASQTSFGCADVGANTVTLTVTDNNGNVSTCDATVTVQDSVAPTALCQNITIQLDAAGSASITAADIDNGSNDACGIASLSASQTSFGCADVGANTVTLTVTDNNGNVSTCDATVTVQDSVAPTALCQNITIQLDAAGSASITAADIDNGSNDACGIASLSASQTSFGCADVGANTVTLTVTDNNGNVSTCDATVTVQDSVAPTALCQNITIQLDAAGSASITAADIDNGSNDACGIASLSASQTSFGCADVGANTVTLTVTDNNGNVSTCDATVTVQDSVAPTALCQNITIQLDAAGNATVTAAQIDNGSSDNCSVTSLSLSQTAFTCTDVGANTVTLTVTDVNGNTATCNATVTVEDSVAPTALCQNITIQLDAAGSASITAADIDNGSNDACGIASLSASQTSFGCADVGANTVTLTVTDNNGNVSTCDATVTVQDSVAPTALCQNITIQLDAAGSASITAADIDNGSNDACGIASLSASQTSFGCADVGANTVTLTVTDNNGNVSTCDATVTVQDSVAPTALCQNITIQLDAAGSASITAADIDNGSNDACGIASLSASQTSFGCADVGANTVTLTVTDNNGNVSTCDATVTVQDSVAPTALCQNITIQLDAAGSASITAADIDNGSNDACGIASLSASQTSFGCADVGANTVTLTVTDNNGNVSTCDATVTVQDSVAPTALCQNITIQLDAAGSASITAADIDNGSNDACGIASLSASQTSFGCADVGANTVTLTVTDNNGNVSTCDATVTVQDSVAPTALCQNITIQLDAAGSASITAADIDNGSNDACGIASLSASQTSFGCADVGANTVTLTVTDNNGNVSTCDATVTVQDSVAPTALCQNITIQLDAAGSASITAADIDNGSNDACGIASLSASQTSFGCADVGANTVTLTVTDNNGNVSTCDATVTVQDSVAPTALCQNITIQLDAAGSASITAADIDNGSNDACGIASLSASQTSFGCADVGANTVTLTVTDNNGNVSTCDATVTVEDNVNPSAVCQDVTIQLDAAGNATVTAAQIDYGSSDNCSVASLSLSQTAFTCADVGANTVTLTVTDVNGNTATCNATVTVEDNIPPVLTPGSNQNVNLNGSCQIIIPNVRGTATDNCSVTITQSPAQGAVVSATHNNPVTVTVTATDASGNTDIETVILTPRDVTLPTISCPSNITVTNDSGVCGANVTYVSPTFNDNCSGATISQTAGLASGSTFPVGTTTNTFVVTDLAGNTRSCSFTVTVTDNQPPVLNPAPNQNVNLNASCQILVPDVRGTATDNCTNPVTITQVPAQNLPVGATHNSPITITVTATDAAGNQDIETVIVTPIDVTAPTISCPGNQSVNFDASCQFILADYSGLASSSDNCDTNVTITQSPAVGTLLSGATTVTLTATDNAGNSDINSSCSFQVIPNDITPPNAVCQDITVSLGVTGSVNIIPTAVDGGSSDTCGPVFFSISDSNFTCADIGANTVTLTVSDNSGNTSSCIATVTVVDDTAPTMQCNNFVVVINPLTQVATINANDIDNGSNDACGLSSLTVSPNTFDTTQLGDNTVTLTATDTHGNSNTCTAIVTVEPPINEDTILTGTIVNPLEPGESPLPPSALIEATACPGGITAPRDIDLTLQAADPTTYNLQANQVIEWQISQDNGETWNVLPSSAGTLSYTLTNISDDTFIRVRVYDANDPTLQQFSSQVFIRFLPPDEPPVLTSDPRFDICLGESVLLTAESFFDQPNGQFGEGGEFNYAQPDGWRVNYVDGDFPASGDNGREEDWKETNSNNNALFSNINYDTADNTKFALAHGVGNTTQLETPVFSTIGMTSAEAIMTFDTSFFFCNGGYGTIWLSFDSGVTYAPANELTAYWEGTNTPINFTTGNDTGIHVTKQGNCNSANSQRASTDPRMTAAYINLGPYVGLSGLRVRFEFFGSTSTCTNVAFPPAPGNNCNPVRTFDVASGWAIDNVGFAYAGVDDELEWTDEEGNVIAIGSQATVQPITPGIRNYGVTNLVNGCRAPGEDGTNDDTLVYTSLAYAGPDYIPSGNQCGENFVQLRAYDNTIKSRANYALGNWETGLYDVPVDDASDYDPTGVGGQWTIVNSTTTSCGNLATFSSNTDPNASFNASPGTYTLRWTLNDGSGCFDDVVVTVVDCPTIDFDGINDHIDFRNHYNFDSTYDTDGHFSIEVWVKPNSVNGTKTVFSRKDDAVNTAGYALTVVDGQVRFNWYKSAGSGSITSGGLSIGTDRWYHLAVTFNGSEYLMYVDGILISTQSGLAPDATPNNIKALLGATDQAPPNEATKYFHGWMDELRIWTRALDVQHIRQMMNQEINASGANVMGTVIPTKIYGPDTNADGVEDDPLLWSELEGYYRMNVACGDFSPYKGVAGRLRNIQTSQQETAPLPYTSRANSSWDTDNTWTFFSVWDVPNSIGIDGTPIDWNIVRTTHNISTNTRNLTVLGLLVDSNKLTVTDLSGGQDENNNGVGLWVTDYLKLNGEIDLVGESQLVQKRISTRQFNESILDVASAGNLERDQQGTTNLFNYNYFSSPVGRINTAANNVPENLVNLLLDGTVTTNNPHPVINWTSSYNATGTINPITLSNRWIYAYENFPFDNYASWNYKGNTGTLDPGYGFTMKGSGVGVGAEGDIITGGNQLNGIQNYVFKGKPNNQDIIIPITSWYQALVGNPYPSAIDSHEFIDDNIPIAQGGNIGSGESTEGTLYFWEHYTSNQTHILEEYEGGYAVLNKSGGLPVYEPALISGNGASTKTPGRYVPVGQGFFVGSVFNYSGNVKFENDQRVFQREGVGNSVFLRNGNTKTKQKSTKEVSNSLRTIDAVDSQNEELVISRVRLNFTSHIDGKIRPLLLAFTSDNSATDGVDYGYDASNTYFQNNDAFFIVEDGVYVVQGVGAFDEEKRYPLGIFLSENSDVEVALTDLENFDEAIDVFIYDALLDTYTKLNGTNFESNLDPDYYFDRFFITFKESSTLKDDEILKDDFAYVAYLDVTKDIYIKLPTANVTQVKLISVLGQTVRTWDTGLEAFYSNAYRIPVSGLPIGTYILNVETETTTISKKVIIK